MTNQAFDRFVVHQGTQIGDQILNIQKTIPMHPKMMKDFLTDMIPKQILDNDFKHIIDYLKSMELSMQGSAEACLTSIIVLPGCPNNSKILGNLFGLKMNNISKDLVVGSFAKSLRHSISLVSKRNYEHPVYLLLSIEGNLTLYNKHNNSTIGNYILNQWTYNVIVHYASYVNSVGSNYCINFNQLSTFRPKVCLSNSPQNKNSGFRPQSSHNHNSVPAPPITPATVQNQSRESFASTVSNSSNRPTFPLVPNFTPTVESTRPTFASTVQNQSIRPTSNGFGFNNPTFASTIQNQSIRPTFASTVSNQSTRPGFALPVQSTRPVFGSPVQNQSTRPVFGSPVQNQSTRPVFGSPVQNQSTRPGFALPVSNQSTRPGFGSPVQNQSTRPGFGSGSSHSTYAMDFMRSFLRNHDSVRQTTESTVPNVSTESTVSNVSTESTVPNVSTESTVPNVSTESTLYSGIQNQPVTITRLFTIPLNGLSRTLNQDASGSSTNQMDYLRSLFRNALNPGQQTQLESIPLTNPILNTNSDTTLDSNTDIQEESEGISESQPSTANVNANTIMNQLTSQIAQIFNVPENEIQFQESVSNLNNLTYDNYNFTTAIQNDQPSISNDLTHHALYEVCLENAELKKLIYHLTQNKGELPDEIRSQFREVFLNNILNKVAQSPNNLEETNNLTNNLTNEQKILETILEETFEEVLDEELKNEELKT